MFQDIRLHLVLQMRTSQRGHCSVRVYGDRTNAMLYCCSQVTAGDGHSRKGSLVSDTVKRGCSSVPVVSVQRQITHSLPSNGKGKHFYPCYSLCLEHESGAESYSILVYTIASAF